MKKTFFILNIILSVLAGTAIAAEPSKEMAQSEVLVTEVSVREVQQFVNDKKGNVAILDANNDSARNFAGVVPGAILLSSYNEYAVTELPKDTNTTLVFYCYNSYCQASHLAAQRAIFAGYKDARVMKAGIMGWNKANPKT